MLNSPPNDSASMPWHYRHWEQCQRMERNERFPHAFLLRGPRGTGKRAFAMRWANALVCQGPEPESQPCGRCRGCRLFAAGTHPDVKIIAPPPDKKSIGIDGIRALIDYVWLSRQLAERKVILLPDAQELTIAAANTLLKTLEEPPGNVVFILIVERGDQLPITIRSRCQFLDFPAPPREIALPWLTKQLLPDHGPDAQKRAAPLLAAAHGAPLLAARYGQDDTLSERMRFSGELTDLLTGKGNPLEIATRWKTLGCAVVLPWSMGYITDLIGLCFTKGANSGRAMIGSAVDSDGAGAMDEIARRLDPRRGYRLLDHCLETLRLLEEGFNLNEALLLEGLAIDFARPR